MTERKRRIKINSACTQGGSSLDVAFTSEQRMCCKPSAAKQFVPVTSRSGQFEGWDTESGDQPENCCHTLFWTTNIHLYGLDLTGHWRDTGGTTEQIASAPTNDCARVLVKRNYEDLGVMALDLLRWESDHKSDSVG